MDPSSSNPPSGPLSVEERIDQAWRAIERRVAVHSPLSATLAEVRAAAHRLRSALTPVSNNVQFVLVEERLSVEAQSALGDARAALGRALETVDALASIARARQSRFELSEALACLQGGREWPAAQVAGDPEYLIAAVEALLGEHPQARLTVRAEGRLAQVEIAAGAPLDPHGYAATLARRLARQLDGELEVSGAAACLRLPLAADVADLGQAPIERAGVRSLLVVDDEPDLVPLFKRYLRREFDEIIEADSAEKAERLLVSRKVTHLVVDAALPDCGSGAELIQRWRTTDPTIRFAAIFSGAARALGASHQSPGVDAVFLKPDGFEDLVAALKQAGL